MPEYILRHTYYSKVVAANAVQAMHASVDIVEEVKEQLVNIGVEIMQVDTQKSWELVQQQMWQTEK